MAGGNVSGKQDELNSDSALIQVYLCFSPLFCRLACADVPSDLDPLWKEIPTPVTYWLLCSQQQ